MRLCALVLWCSWAAWAGEPERRALQYAAPLVPSPGPTETQHRGVNLTLLDSTRPVSGNGPIVLGAANNASVMLRGPVDDGSAVCPAVRGEVPVPSFQGAQVFEVFEGGQAATQPRSRSPFAEDDSRSATAHWRMVYPHHCVDLSIYKNDGADPGGVYVLGRARALGAAVHRGMVEAGLATAAPPAADRGKALCEEALAAFGLRQPDATHLRRDFADLDSGFRGALERYAKEAGQPAFSSVPLAGSARALNWLFAEGGTLNNLSPEYRDLSEEFVFTEPGDANRLLARQKLVLEGSVQAKPGTEAALLRSIVELHERERKRVEPGDVFFLALKQARGDARLATLLAHNTLRSLARGADGSLTGVAPNSEFFEKILAPIRGGPLAVPGISAVEPPPSAGEPSGTAALPGPTYQGDPFAHDNAGPWYHLFGTAFFELQVQGDFGPVLVAVMGGAGGPPPALPQGKLDASSVSQVANSLEQYYREWLSGKVPDPEKYCFNVWGAQLGALLSKGLVDAKKPRLGPAGARAPKRAPPAPGFDPTRPGVSDDAISLPPPLPSPAPAAHATSSRPVDPRGLRKWALFSAASITWEGNGRTMVLDQRTGKLAGYFPVRLAVFPEADGSLGAVWVDTVDRPYTLRLRGTGQGELHLLVTEPNGPTRAFVAPATPAASYSMFVGGGAPASLVDQKGAPVREIVGGAPSCAAQLEQARAAHQAAFSRYTALATEGGAGDLQKALGEYRRAYERVQALERGCSSP